MFNSYVNRFPLLSNLWIEKEFEILSNVSTFNKNKSAEFLNNFISFKVAVNIHSHVEKMKDESINEDFIKKFLLYPRKNNISGIDELQTIYTNISRDKCTQESFLNILRNYYLSDYKIHLTYIFLVLNFKKIKFLKSLSVDSKDNQTINNIYNEIKDSIIFPKYLIFKKEDLIHFIKNEKGYLL